MNEMFKNVIVSLAVSLLVVGGYAMLVGGNSDQSVGASGTRFPNGLSTTNTSPTSGQVVTNTLTTSGDAVFGGGVDGVVVTTANTATSSLTVGCINMYATSTETSWKAYASSTATIEGVDGVMLMMYGTCP